MPKSNKSWLQAYHARRRALADVWYKASERWLTRHQLHIQAWTTAAVFFLGLQLILAGGWYFLYKQTVLSFHVSPVVTAEAQLRHSRPVSIDVPSAGINLSILPTGIVDGVWQTSDTAATHLVTSAHPGEGGNIVMYGHNRQHLFAPLHRVREGDSILLKNEDNTLFEYKVTSITRVKPSQIDAVLPTDHEVLTVYTCTGFLDSERLVIQAAPVRVASGS